MDLERRCGKQDETLVLFPAAQFPHEPQQCVRALLSRACSTPARVMGFVQDNNIPRLSRIQQFCPPILTAREMAGHDDKRLTVPSVAGNSFFNSMFGSRRMVPNQLLAVVDRPIQVKFLAQLDLPLLTNRLWRQDDRAFYAVGEPPLSKQQPGLNCLAEAHFVSDQEL